jgi:hypothetical protein
VKNSSQPVLDNGMAEYYCYLRPLIADSEEPGPLLGLLVFWVPCQFLDSIL